MSDRLSRLLAARPWLLADGATGTNLFAAGLESGDSPELWNVDHPDRIEALHRGFIEAGADIFLTNSFGGSSYRLKLHQADTRVRELNAAAAAIARRVADAYEDKLGREIAVAGSIGPTGEIFEPVGALSIQDGTRAFAEQAEALAEGGADVLWIETLSSVEELTAAMTGAGTTGLPLVCTMSFDTNGRTMMGITPAQIAELVRTLSPAPIAYGGNCGVGPSELMAAVVNMSAARRPDDVIVAKSNCGVPEFVEGEIHYCGTPELMADYARMARDAGVRIIGGCCGTTAKHVQVMREALEDYEPSRPPTLEAIEARLGDISAGTRTMLDGPTPESRRRTSRRRRAQDDGAEQR